MKHNAIARIVIYSITIFLLVAILLAGLALHTYTFLPGQDGKEVYSEGTSEPLLLDPQNIRDIEIEWVSGKIIVQTGNVENITITESAVSDSKYALVWSENNGKLSIQFCRDALNFSIGIHNSMNLDKSIVITVPESWKCRTLEIETASSDVEIGALTIQEVDIDAASAECLFNGSTVDMLNVDTASGDVRFTGTLEELDFDAASASFIGTFSNTPHRFNMDSMSGNLDITLPEGSGFRATLDGMSSQFSSDFSTTSKNGTYICGDEACLITVSAMSGDLIIRKGN